MEIEFVGVLRDYQRNLRREAVRHLNQSGSVLLKLHCGAGKTCLSINIATKIMLDNKHIFLYQSLVHALPLLSKYWKTDENSSIILP